MAKPNEAYIRNKNGYYLNDNKDDKDDKNSNPTNNDILKCEDCSGKGHLWVTPENYQVVKHINAFTAETKYTSGKPFIKVPWERHVQIIDVRASKINPKIKDFITNDGDTASIDFSLEFEIIDLNQFRINSKNFEQKINERIASSIQVYIRQHTAEYIATHTFDFKSFDPDAYDKIQKDFGIIIKVFNTTTIKLNKYDKSKSERLEKLMEIDNHKKELESQKAIEALKKEVDTGLAEIEDEILKNRIAAIQSKINGYAPEQQAELLKSILEMIYITKSSADITYIPSGTLGNFGGNKR